MDPELHPITRHALLRHGVTLIGSLAALAATGTPRSALAAKASKQDFFYQNKPKGDKSCASCRLYSASADGRGECAIVDGEVSPNGWCMAYSART